MCRIEMVLPGGNVVIMGNGDQHLDLFEACHRAELYKRKSPNNTFRVINNENQDLEMEI